MGSPEASDPNVKRKIICLTPVRNEAWILETFLQCTSLWADHIVVADQGSTDESLEIINKFENVLLIKNESNIYNEHERQNLLIETARKAFGPDNILVALDADEILVNYKDNPEWDAFINLEKGTAVAFPWLNVLPGNKTYFDSVGEKFTFGYIDDGRKHSGVEIHSPRIPLYPDTNNVYFKSIKVLHFQWAVRDRQYAKHRWYECLERIKFPEKSNIEIYRIYHHIDLPIKQVRQIPLEWVKHFKDSDIELESVKDDGKHWWDKEVCELFDVHGVEKFKKQAIWNVDWDKRYKYYYPGKQVVIKDPRNALDKAVHAWLRRSQKDPRKLGNRIINRILMIIKW